MQLSGIGVGGLMVGSVPVLGHAVSPGYLLDRAGAGSAADVAMKKRMADIALNAARSKGASYTDVRIGRYLQQYLFTREQKVQNVVSAESYGVGIRVIANGTWGFAPTRNVTPDGIARCAETAVAIAKANSKLQKEPVVLAPQKGVGEVTWKTPLTKNAFTVPVGEKVDLLMKVNSEAVKNGAAFVTSNLFFVNEQKYFASTDGSYIDQDIHRIWPTFTVSAIDRATGKFKTRDALSSPMGMGYEYLDGLDSEKIKAPNNLVGYRNSYDMVEDATLGAKQVKEKIGAKSVQSGKYDLVLDPNHLGLTIHESVGHPLELDRVLGYEANYAGTSFATLDKWQTKKFKFGSERVNFFADKTTPGSLAAVGFDDEGVASKR